MTTRDAYEDLYELYSIFNVHIVAEPMMELLRAQFTFEEAELAVKVDFSGGTLDELQQKTGMEKNKLKRMLETMADKGTVWIDPGVEDPVYKTMGLAGPGLVETGGWGNIKFPNSVQLMKTLHKFEVDFATKWLPAIGAPVTRVWLTPAALPKDAKPEENVAELMKKAGPWGVSTCSCRLPHWLADPGNHCTFPVETCLFTGKMTKWGLERNMCREITCEESLEIIRKCNELGMVHTHDPNEFLCNCCNDCCVMLMGQYRTGAQILQPSEFIPVVDEDSCSGCETCAERCPMDAITVEETASINLDKCLGCGVCFPACPTESINFVRRPIDTE
jgi:Pyruvate/2-oxoacid:ferredoxin oxidoreductase delta subunit